MATATNKRKLDCFGVVRLHMVGASDVSVKFLQKSKAVFNPELGQYDIVDDEPVNLDEVIQSYKDDCGLEMFKRMQARGEDLSQFADDGLHSADLTQVHVELVDSKRQIASQAEVIAAIAQALGINVTSEITEDEVRAALEKKTTQEVKTNE